MKEEQEIRLNKYLAQCGICSRREADKLIEQGLVCINGQKAQTGSKVLPQDEVTLRGKIVQSTDRKIILAYYKPVGVVCTEKDKHAKVKVLDNLNYPVRVTYAGRLDKDSEGLLLMTNDGDLIDAMMRGANGHEKEYQVKVNKELTREAIDILRAGVYLEELEITTRPCEIVQTGSKTMQMILTQGVNRQIRRMCQTVGYEVKELKRTRVMNVKLANLKPGEYRELTKEEQQCLYQMCTQKR